MGGIGAVNAQDAVRLPHRPIRLDIPVISAVLGIVLVEREPVLRVVQFFLLFDVAGQRNAGESQAGHQQHYQDR